MTIEYLLPHSEDKSFTPRPPQSPVDGECTAEHLEKQEDSSSAGIPQVITANASHRFQCPLLLQLPYQGSRSGL